MINKDNSRRFVRSGASIYRVKRQFNKTGIGSDRACKEAADAAFSFLKANGNRISGVISITTKEYIVNYQDLQGIGMTSKLALPTLSLWLLLTFTRYIFQHQKNQKGEQNKFQLTVKFVIADTK